MNHTASHSPKVTSDSSRCSTWFEPDHSARTMSSQTWQNRRAIRCAMGRSQAVENTPASSLTHRHFLAIQDLS
jgi:hypothetical protein